jgi:hypothetical protein
MQGWGLGRSTLRWSQTYMASQSQSKTRTLPRDNPLFLQQCSLGSSREGTILNTSHLQKAEQVLQRQLFSLTQCLSVSSRLASNLWSSCLPPKVRSGFEAERQQSENLPSTYGKWMGPVGAPEHTILFGGVLHRGKIAPSLVTCWSVLCWGRSSRGRALA